MSHPVPSPSKLQADQARWHFPFAVSVAVSTRIGHLIGAGRVDAARRASILYGVVFTAIGFFDGLFLFVFRRQLASLISDDPVVQRIAAGSMLSVAIFQVIDAIIAGCNGMLRGLGRQHIAAWVVLIVNYLGAVPTSMWLMLGPPGLQLDGLWIGIGLGMVLTAVVECIYMVYIKWQDCVEDVRKREDS